MRFINKPAGCIMADNSIKKINLLNERDVSHGIFVKLQNDSRFSTDFDNGQSLLKDRNEYFDSIEKTEKFLNEYSVYKGVTYNIVENLYDDIVLYSKVFCGVVKVKILNYGYEGRANGVTDKVDIVVVLNDTPIKLSLKVYKAGDSVQIASGTFVSTVCSLAYLPVSPGKYMRHSGETFSTMNKRGQEKMYAFMLEDFGDEMVSVVKSIKDLDKQFRDLITQPYIGDNEWEKVCKKVGMDAIPLMTRAFSIVKTSNQKEFVNRVCARIGIDGSDDVIIGQGEKYFSSINNIYTKNILKLVNLGKVDVIMRQSGKGGEGKGIKFDVVDIDTKNVVLSFDMPLTVNKNGAWQLDDVNGRYCATDKAFIKYGDPRPVKAKQIATSTNCYIKTKTLFGDM